MLVRYLFVGTAILACGSLQAGPCVLGTLLSYEALGATGCTIGSLTVNGFAFGVLGSSGGAVAVTDAQISVMPTNGPGVVALNFASTGFNVTGSGSIQYLIAYTWDPHNDIQRMDDIMNLPSAVLGFANVTTVGCLNAAFVGSTCSTATATVTVFDNNGTTQVSNSAATTPVQILGIRNTIDLEAKGGSASFDSFTNEAEVPVPEPATWPTCAGALLLIGAHLRCLRSLLHS
jgi:hypothetical protein